MMGRFFGGGKGFGGGGFGGGGSRQRLRLRDGSGGGHGRGGPAGAENVPTLDRMPLGAACRIVRLRGRGAVRQRLLDMGFVPNAEVMVIRSAPLLDPIEVRIGESFVSIRRTEAALIEVDHDE